MAKSAGEAGVVWSVMPVAQDTRLDFTCKESAISPFCTHFLRILSSPFMCHLVAAFPALSAPSGWVMEPLLHAPASRCPSSTGNLCCAYPRMVSSGVHRVLAHVLAHPGSPGAWSPVSHWLTRTCDAFRVVVLVAQLCPTLCDPIDCSPPASSVHGTLQAGILEWVAIPFSRGPSPLRDRTQISCTAGRFFTVWATRGLDMFLSFEQILL